MSDETVKFRVLCNMFEALVRNKSLAMKRKHFRKFLDDYYVSRSYFSAIRLILPSLDRERASYGLKESVLATCLIDALGMSRESEDALRLINWRRGGAKTGANAGNFALVAFEMLQRRQGTAPGELKIKELNDLLDRLASAKNREDKTAILSDLIKQTNALEMKWVIMIILKELKLGVSEKSIFHEFHPDAEDLFNVTCDLKLVCEELRDRTRRHKRQDIEVGKAVRSQVALRVIDAASGWKKLHGKEVVVECKFDGDRIQIHKNGAEICYFSRNFFEHQEYGHGMSSIIQQCAQVDRCILDGEMLVWDTSTHRFADFGSNQEAAKAAKEGSESDRQLCYVAFDILYVGDTSVIHQSLRERHDLLRKVIKPLKGRLEILVPNGGLNASLPSGEPCWSIIARSVEDVENFFKETIENRDEGIILKDLGSKWEPGDRSAKWLKLKPDYINPGSDLDVLIIGGYFGTQRHGGEVAQFLVGLAEGSSPNSYPKRFISFCRVGTGLSDDALDTLVTKLKPYFSQLVWRQIRFLTIREKLRSVAQIGVAISRQKLAQSPTSPQVPDHAEHIQRLNSKNDAQKKAPSFYVVTNNSRANPDVWIESPEKSVIVSITGDVRTIKSAAFAAAYSLRFPRILQVRYDKPWYDCLDAQSFSDLVQSCNGNTRRGTELGGLQAQKQKRIKSSRRGNKKSASVVPSHFVQTDVSGIKGTSCIFTNMMFYFVNVPSDFSIDSFHKMVVENGGTFSMNLNDLVTHCIAAERKGIKYQAAMRHGDVIHYSWILDCCSQKCRLNLLPKYFLFFSDSSKHKLQEDVDLFSDYYYWDIDVADIKQIFKNMDRLDLANRGSIDYYKKKYCPMEKWCLFQDCQIYFYNPGHLTNMECEGLSEISFRRMKLEVSMRGGQISNSLSCATHLVVLSMTNPSVDFATIFDSFSAAQKHLLNNKKLRALRYQWLEDSLEMGKKLQEDAYSLKPNGPNELLIDEQCGSALATCGDESQVVSASPDRNESRRKRTPNLTRTKRGRTGVRQSQRTRARHGNRPAKISKLESNSSDSSDEISGMDEFGSRGLEKQHAVEKEKIEGGSQVGESDKIRRKEEFGPRGRRRVGQPQRTHTRLGNRPAKICRKESKSSDFSDEIGGLEVFESRGFEKAHGVEKEKMERTQVGETGKISRTEELEPRQTGRDSMLGIEDDQMKQTQDVKPYKITEMEEFGLRREGKRSMHAIEEKVMGTQNHGTGESTIDPVEAMLMDMIPSLGLKSSETKNAVFSDDKSQVDTGSNPVKKKRVSYKDLADQLLKDE